MNRDVVCATFIPGNNKEDAAVDSRRMRPLSLSLSLFLSLPLCEICIHFWRARARSLSFLFFFFSNFDKRSLILEIALSEIRRVILEIDTTIV